MTRDLQQLLIETGPAPSGQLDAASLVRRGRRRRHVRTATTTLAISAVVVAMLTFAVPRLPGVPDVLGLPGGEKVPVWIETGPATLADDEVVWFVEVYHPGTTAPGEVPADEPLTAYSGSPGGMSGTGLPPGPYRVMGFHRPCPAEGCPPVLEAADLDARDAQLGPPRGICERVVEIDAEVTILVTYTLAPAGCAIEVTPGPPPGLPSW